MPQCRMFHCKTNAGKGISMFRFPSDGTDPTTKKKIYGRTAEKWLQLCGIEFKSFKDYNFDNKFICALHFKEDDYERDLKSELLPAEFDKRPPKLNPGVVPSVNLPPHKQAKTKPRKSSVERIARTEKRRVIQDATVTPACKKSKPDNNTSAKQIPATLSRPPQEGPVHSKTLQPSAIEQQVATLSTSTKSPSPEVRDLSSVNGQVCSPNLRFLELNHSHDFHRRKNVHSQTAPSLTSTETQTNWDDPLLTKDKCEEQIPASTPPTQSASLPTQSASLTIQPPEPAATPPLLFALVKQQQEPPSATSSPIMLDHTYYIPNETPVQAPPKQVIDETTAVDDEDHDEEDDASDPDYHPSSDESSSSDEEDDSPNQQSETLVNEKKYLVFDSALRGLISQVRCKTCDKVLLIGDKENTDLGKTKGTMLTVKLECINGHPWSWQSQPILGVGNEAVPAGNLLTSAGILFSGTKFTTMEYFANFINLEFISESTYTDHENDYLFPVVHETWHFERDTLWRTWKDLILKLSGDGRCDSPGFSAKYCTYVMMDMDTGKVVDIQTISVNEVSSSNAMEKEGCRRSLEKLKEHGMEVGILCTDRHGGIAAMLRDEYPAIDHQFDLWHLAKSTTKKLNAKAKKRECQELGAWMPSVRNHLWWAAATCGGDKVELLEKWRSVVYHTTNQHEWGGTQVYNMCAHTPLSEADRLAKKWIESGSPAHEALSDVVNDKSILKGINQVNLFCHTGKTECFNSSLTKFAPKRVHFPYEGMVVRTKLAAIDNNHNTGRAQARVKRKTKHSGPVGSLRYKVVHPKAKKKWIAKPIFEKKSYGYVYDMLAGVLVKKLLNKKGTSTDIFDPPADAMKENIASVANPGKEAVVEAHISRF